MLAIVIPYYKLTFFKETLDSLANQSDKRFKVYIGDDASPENPEELLKMYEGKFDFVYKKFEENLGAASLVKQWERCIELTGDEQWLMILGDDDVLGENVVEEFYKNLPKVLDNKIHVLKFNTAVIDSESRVIVAKKQEPEIKSAIQHFFTKFTDESRSSLSEHVFRKEKYDLYGFEDFPLAWHSDDYALLRFSEFGNLIFIKDAKCLIRISDESISGQTKENMDKIKVASQLFFNKILLDMNRFSRNEKTKLFDLIQWQQHHKNIKIKIPNKAYEYYRSYGFIKTLKLLMS